MTEANPEAAAVKPEDDILFASAMKFAAKDERFAATLFSFFTIDDRSLEMLASTIPAMLTTQKSWHPFGVLVADLNKREILKTEEYVIGAPPTLKLFTDQRKLKMPSGNYLVLFSPCVQNEKYLDHLLAKRTINVVLGLLTASVGKFAFLDHLADQILIPSSLQESSFGRIFRLPHPDDFVHVKDPAALAELSSAIHALPEDVKNQILYIMEMFGRAVQERDGAFQFSLYWITLELVSQTKGDGVAAKLGNAYGEKKEFAYDTLEFRAIYNLRNRYFHKGFIPSLSSRAERLVQLYFLDLLRLRLGLPCKQLALSALAAFAAD